MANTLTLAERMRVGHVHRWNIVRTAREQTIGEHMYRVWLIVQEVCRVANIDSHVAQIASDFALLHDLPEVVTGDIPTPMKQFIETRYPRMLLQYERSIDADVAMSLTAATTYPLAAVIVKISDLFEAVLFLQVEGMGARASDIKKELEMVLENKIEQARAYYPDVNWTAVDELFTETMVRT